MRTPADQHASQDTDAPDIFSGKRISRASEDPWVEVLCCVEGDSAQPRAFRLSAITGLRSASAHQTVLEIKGRENVVLNIPYAALREKIFNNDGNIIDLKSYLPPEQAIGTFFEGRGIFMGRYTPVDCSGQSLGKIFNVYAAPAQLTYNDKEAFTYNEARVALDQLNVAQGFNSMPYSDDTEFYEALKNGSYDGAWIIPPRELVDGKNTEGTPVHAEHLLRHQAKKVFKSAISSENYLWTSSKTNNGTDRFCNLRMDGGRVDFDTAGTSGAKCWPMRLTAVV